VGLFPFSWKYVCVSSAAKANLVDGFVTKAAASQGKLVCDIDTLHAAIHQWLHTLSSLTK
jgi:hypothetical protein